ncbi:hypothetical protein LTR56_001562 [Elasticomyces elasticus]|nr:hypothetical protein LTR56_001562 [Elasticomyces elasticus]KAK3667385.1 hypothetical protein LTR22_001901 [Elasticomyces elasticus]KAK4932534.1 hypothetical protein LTR49_000958 [Elasticomyces elasticus]KAK5769556.1 hypothetical protein LTS12_000006 [Elasticomyces elasticus]
MAATFETDVSSSFPYTLYRAKVLGLEMAYVDTQPGKANKDIPTALFLHGNPTSSYLWRNVIPHVSPIMRCVAPDLIGMGQSSKPANMPYRFTDHYTFLSTFINTVIPSGPVLLIVQDWGSALGLHWAYQQAELSSTSPTRVLGIALMEFVRPFPSWAEAALPEEMEKAFKGFRDPLIGRKAIIEQNAFVEQFHPQGQLRGMTDEEREYLGRPYLDQQSREPIWMWTNQVPIEGRPSDVYDIATRYHDWLLRCEVPKLLLWATPGILVKPEQAQWYLENMKNVEGVDLGAGLHFLMEDHPKATGEAIAAWAKRIVQLEERH